MERKRAYTKCKNNPASFRPGAVPWNKGMKDVYSRSSPVSEETRRKIGDKSRGRKHTQEAKDKMSIGHKGKPSSFAGRKHTDEARALLSEHSKRLWEDDSYRELVIKNRIGKQARERSFLWKGGITPLHLMIRSSFRYMRWVKLVFTRDNFICQDCGASKCYLEAHHIKRFSFILKEFLDQNISLNPIEDKDKLLSLSVDYEPFWELSNGVTLCCDCHNLTKRKGHICGKKESFNNVGFAQAAYGLC